MLLLDARALEDPGKEFFSSTCIPLAHLPALREELLKRHRPTVLRCLIVIKRPVEVIDRVLELEADAHLPVTGIVEIKDLLWLGVVAASRVGVTAVSVLAPVRVEIEWG